MTDWEEIRDLTDDSVPPSSDDEVLASPSIVDPAVVVAYLQEWFGQDDARHGIRIVLDGVDEGMLLRTSLYNLSGSGDRGGLGSGDYATVPGVSTAYVPLRLVCSRPGCQVHATVVSFDLEDPPSCPLHHTPLGLGD